MIDYRNYIYLFSHCKTTKGHARSIICDLERGEFEFIPNSLVEIIKFYNGERMDNILADFDEEQQDTIKEYLNFLIEKGFCFQTKLKTPIVYSNKKYEYAEEILNCIIDFDDESNHDLDKIIENLNNIGVPYVQLRFYNKVLAPDYIEKILKKFNKTRCRYIELILPYSDNLNSKIEECIPFNRRLQSVVFYNAISDKKNKINKCNLFYYCLNIVDETHCGKNNPSMFTIGTRFHNLSTHCNTCLFKKISVDKKGEIKNCPSLKVSFGNINNSTLNSAMNKKGFRDLWFINKEQIDTCNICEFRNVCTDCRAYTESSGKYSKPIKCNYDPITMEWN
ncbi:grasp-with-spasm system SPASM domain peptide maturase [uncultured Tenacibaculum sp.]|uniref:grasp-with-spasm system SPASM domain peptide maturase n=1 Tax=uncultured Tenacibaculum sp. TaxID=174713 RepID=UPI0026202837|nr:grasp-with-spasm system SPASM domain peptide maturase [uncultured Tenacibaculum sp.]